MDEQPDLRRAFFRGYRQGDVELALARATLLREQLQVELDAARARSAAMQTEITELHRRIDDQRRREIELGQALDDLRERRDALERDASSRAQRILSDAEQRATAIRTDGIRQVGELQLQVEQLLGLRAGLSAALKRVTQDISDSLDRLAAAPARAIEHNVAPPPHSTAPETADEIDERFFRSS
ncbi:MAG TPA: hypothetical protein VFB25_11855 [Gaiellaceae bacterium]|nr:hypothetical protein [Gaiellaceae bacterium]